jgi:hypothetical protein
MFSYATISALSSGASSVTTTTATPSFLRSTNIRPDVMDSGVPKSKGTNPDDYKIVLILDESGSMSSIKSHIVDSINDLIRKQKEVKGRTTLFTLIKFNNETRTIKQNADFSTIDYLANSEYNPSGGTALYDAIGETLEAYKDEKNVLIVIITDGEENTSRKYCKADVAPKIDSLKTNTEKGWSFVYIGCDLETAKQGDKIGLATSANACNYGARSKVEMCNALGHLSSGITEQRCDVVGKTVGGSRGFSTLQNKLQSLSAATTTTTTTTTTTIPATSSPPMSGISAIGSLIKTPATSSPPMSGISAIGSFIKTPATSSPPMFGISAMPIGSFLPR